MDDGKSHDDAVLRQSDVGEEAAVSRDLAKLPNRPEKLEISRQANQVFVVTISRAETRSNDTAFRQL
jgi:hypothetical protein